MEPPDPTERLISLREPAFLHTPKKLNRDRISGPRTNHGVDAALGTHGCLLALVVDTNQHVASEERKIFLFNPIDNLRGRKDSQATTAPTYIAPKDLRPITEAMRMSQSHIIFRCFTVGHDKRRFSAEFAVCGIYTNSALTV